VARQFDEPRIQKIVENVAANEAKVLLTQEIRPEVEKFKSETGKSIESFRALTQGVEARYKADFSRIARNLSELDTKSQHATRLATGLSVSVGGLEDRARRYDQLNQAATQILDDLTQRRRISDLGVRAIGDADRAAFRELDRIAATGSVEIRDLARSELMRTKAFWVAVTRTAGASVKKDGIKVELAKLTTCELVQGVLGNPDWIVRTVFITELGQRKEAGVPDTILTVIKNDQNLEVLKDAVVAWNALTGYHSPDVFGEPHIENWWKDNRDGVQKTLVPTKCNQVN
jgi:hypothetical protein